MSEHWLRLPVRSRDDSLSELACDAQVLESEARAVVRQLVLDAVGSCATVGELVDRIECANPTERRALLNRAHTGAGLTTVEDAEAHDRFEAANDAIRRHPRAPLPRCPVFGASPTTGGGFPDPNWGAWWSGWCTRHLVPTCGIGGCELLADICRYHPGGGSQPDGPAR